MQFEVPQFETESKLFGPFTIAQFTYVSISAMISFIIFPIFVIWLWLIISTLLIGGSVACALVKISGRPMLIFLSSAFEYLWGPKILLANPPLIDKSTGLKNIKSLDPVKPLAPIKKINPQIIATPDINKSETISSPDINKPKIIFSPTVTISESQHNAISPSFSIEPPIISKPDHLKIPTFYPSQNISESNNISSIKELQGEHSATQKSRLQVLSNQMTTTVSPIPFREERLKQSSDSRGYELIQKTTGETVAVKRIDYR